jgi:hypothetical protein
MVGFLLTVENKKFGKSTYVKNIKMEIDKFEQAKKVKEDLDRLERQKYKLESAFKSCGLGVTIGFNYQGAFNRKGEVSVYNKELIKEMISKELDRLNGEIELVKKEFELL